MSVTWSLSSLSSLTIVGSQYQNAEGRKFLSNEKWQKKETNENNIQLKTIGCYNF